MNRITVIHQKSPSTESPVVASRPFRSSDISIARGHLTSKTETMNTPGTTITNLRRSKRLKSRNVVKAKMGKDFKIVDEEDCKLILDAIPNNFVQSVEIEDETGRIRVLRAWGYDRTDDYDLPEDLGRLSKLEVLEVRSFGLSYIPSSVGMLQNLTEMDLYGNLLSDLPDEIGYLENLETLNLSGNRLTHLPNSIGCLKNLRKLSLGQNFLSVLPEAIGSLSNLQQFCLNYNRRLSSLPEAIGCLKNLRNLSLRGNSLSVLPEAIGSLSNLQEFALNDNPLSSLPTSIGKLKNLTSLDLNDTSIHSLPASFADLESLEFLDISFIPGLKQLPKEILKLSAIRRLGVSGNDSLLRDIGNLKCLRSLWICGLESSYDFSSVQHLQQLEVLNLWGVSTSFDVRKLGVVRKLPKLKELYVMDEDHSRPQHGLRFIRDLIRDTSLCQIDFEIQEENPEIKHALACNRFKFRTPFAAGSNGETLPFLNKLWPRMLANAGCAFAPFDEDLGLYELYPTIGPHDAVHKIVSEGKHFFVQMLISRNSSKSK